jgi:hypothetical protein
LAGLWAIALGVDPQDRAWQQFQNFVISLETIAAVGGMALSDENWSQNPL